MSKTTRKYLWPASLVMSLALVGVLAAFVAMSTVGSPTVQAHDPCADLTSVDAVIECEAEEAANPHDHNTAPPPIDPGTGNGDMMDDPVHATMPMDFWLEGLDNGARLSWEAPETVAENATIYGYQIDRDAWNALASHPINMYGDARFKVYAHETDHSDLGLAYETVYTYMVRAVVQYNVEGWWNMLNCVEMNDAVSPTGDEPAVGADTDGTTYCKMYDDLSAEAMVVVQRAYGALPYTAYTYYGDWSMKRTIETADSGGRLAALLDAPTAVQMLDTSAACANTITVTWEEPTDFGTVPAVDENGVYVGPDYIGGRRAGKEEVGEDATGVTYHVQRMHNNFAWADVTPVGRTYTDTNIAYENTYKYRVRAMNSVGLFGPWSMVTEELTEPKQPEMPRSLNVDPVNGTVELQWDPPSDANGLWRTMDDFDMPGDNSRILQYIVQRKVGNGNWQTLPIENPPLMATKYHQYADNFEDTLTQGFTDDAPPVGSVSYRVAALVHGCNPSPYNQKDPVEVVQQPLGSATGLSAVASATAGTVELSWTAGTSSTRHYLAGVKVSDWRANDFSNVIFRATTSQNSDTVSGLDSGQQYAFTVLSGDNDTWDDTWAPIQYVTPN